MYCYLYSLRLSLDFNFHYLHWMIICNRQAGRKTAGLEQPFYKKTDTQISKQSPTLPPHLHKRRLHTCARPLKLAARMLNPAHRLFFFITTVFIWTPLGIHAPVYHRLQHSLWSHTCLTPVVQQSPTKTRPYRNFG